MSRPTLDQWILDKLNRAGQMNRAGQLQRPLDRNSLSEYQLKMINRTLASAGESSAFYRSRFGNTQIRSLSELSDLPFSTPDDLKADPYAMLCVHPNEIVRIVTLKTSGSTGPSKRVFFTEADLELCTDYFNYGMRCLVNQTDTVGVLFPHSTPASVGDQLIKGLNRLGAAAMPLFGLSQDETFSFIEHHGITSLAGTPGQVGSLAEKYPGLTSIRTVLLSADYVSDMVRETINRAWGAEVFEHYGMTEMGLGCAVSCEYQRGYHVREADLYLEIIDPETGSPLPDGQWGEIVFTSLTRVGMPFIRYRTGDISRWKTERCSCGSTLKLLDYIRDREVKKGSANSY